MFVALIAEFLGTFLLTCFSIFSILLNHWYTLQIWELALFNSVALVLIIYSLGKLANHKINPAVTLGLSIGGHVPIRRAVAEIVCQCCGALCAASLFLYFSEPLGTPCLVEGVSREKGMFLEATVTFILVFTVYLTSIHPNRSQNPLFGPIAIGIVVFCGNLFLVDSTGCILNPARALGPALMYNETVDLFVYVIGPIFGASVAGLLYSQLIFKQIPVE